MPEIVVIGAGIIGLSTAVNIQNRLPTAHVTIMADKFNEDTISDGSGGLIVPRAPGMDKETERRWGTDSVKHFAQLALSEEASECGVYIVNGYVLSNKPEPPLYKDIIISCQPLPQETLQKLGFPYKYGYHSTTTLVESRKYLPWLIKRFQNKGGRILQRKIHSLEELAGLYDVTVNCTGLGSRELVGDDKIIPCKGHILRVSAPWIKTFLLTSDDFYILPSSTSLAVGGIKIYGNDDTSIKPEISTYIWDNVTRLRPSLKQGKILWEWVGIRPHREPVRVESELLNTGGKQMKVVHNYGHGSTGISLSWGTALEAARLVEKMLTPPARL